MIAELRNKQLITNFLVNNAMLGRDSPRPVSLQGVFEWLGFANAGVRISHDFPD
jgi:hypothetical protein